MVKRPPKNRIIKPRRKRILHGLLKNDLEFVDTSVLRDKIHDQSRFSLLYVILLVSSVVVCTLGLLTNSSAIVIGGMLIAPLMWPLARLGYGIALRSPRHLYRGVLLVLASVCIGALSAFLITSISPIKGINEEILARTSPTIMDLFIALTAGVVAAVAITQKKIADSLAGVAIAVSLMPPLCTVGIALSLRNASYSFGALLLFAVNAACITLVTAATLVYIQYKRTGRVHIATRAAVFNVVVILLMSVPLVQFLRSHTFQLSSYNAISSGMRLFIEQKDPTAAFENIEISNADDVTVQVEADLLLPSDSTFTYEDNEVLVRQLEAAVDKDILLNLRIQNIIEPISKNQQDSELAINQLRAEFSEQLQGIGEDMKISSISIQQERSGWVITADILTTPDVVPTNSQVEDMSQALGSVRNEQVEVNLTFVPRLTLRSNSQTVNEEAKAVAESLTRKVSIDAEVSGFTITQSNGREIVSYIVTTDSAPLYDEQYLETVKAPLEALLNNGPLSLKVRVIEAVDLEL